MAAPSTIVVTAPLVAADEYRGRFLEAWNGGTRQDLIDLLATNGNVQSVDVVDFSPTTDELIVEITSVWSGEERRADAAWELTRAMAILWEEGLRTPSWSPSFQFTNSGTTYRCDASFMGQLADVRASRSDWTNACATGTAEEMASSDQPAPESKIEPEGPDPVEVANLSAQVQAQRQYVADWRQYVDDLNSDAAFLIPDLERRIAEAESVGAVNGLAYLRDQLASLQTSINEAGQELRTAEADLATLEAELAALIG